MHTHLKNALMAAACLTVPAFWLGRDVVSAVVIPLAHASNNTARPDAPVLRSETLNRNSNRRRHMDRLYDKMDEDFFDGTISPLFFDGAMPSTVDGMSFSGDHAAASQGYSGRSALTSVASQIDFDSAAGTFPMQSRTSNSALSIWLSGSQADLINNVALSGYDPGLGGDTVSIDSGVDYLVGDGLVVGLGVGWTDTAGEVGARQLQFQETNVNLAPYFVARMTDWLDLRGSLSLGQSTITQTAIGTVPDGMQYARDLDSNTFASSIGFGARYGFGVIPLSVEMSGDMISAREYFEATTAIDGSSIPASTVQSRMLDGAAEARLALGNSTHLFTPFTGSEQTISLMSQGYGRSEGTRYFLGTEYAYTPLDFSLEMQGFRQMATDASMIEGLRSEVNLTRDLPFDWGRISPSVMTEATNEYLELGGGLTHDWGNFPGHMRLEMRRTYSYEEAHGNFSSLVTIDLPF
ncbi:autotransporter outer membrane beta-barrel domain-containing protein [Thalassospira sp. MA62]|nr:autotransporter outer membrane beta-barrel domain-containing protein [Thalassospira sp. MA62]